LTDSRDDFIVRTDANCLIGRFLHFNQFSGTIPAAIGRLTRLVTLNLAVNNLSGSIPASIGNLTNLLTLGLYSNSLNGTLPAELGSLKKLQFLCVKSLPIMPSVAHCQLL